MMQLPTYVLLSLLFFGSSWRSTARRAFGAGSSEHELIAGQQDYPSLLDVHTEVHAAAHNNPLINFLNWLEAEVGNDWQKKGGHGAKDMTGAHTNGASDMAATIKAVQFTAFMVIACVGVFSLLLHRFPAVFAHRALEEFAQDGTTLAMPSSNPISWAARAAEVDDEEAMKLSGLDAVMLGKFLALCRKVLMIVCPTIVFVLVPCHYFFGSRTIRDSKGGVAELDTFSRFGIGAVTSTWDFVDDTSVDVSDQEVANRVLCWIHAGLIFFVCGVTIHYINQGHEEFLKLRGKWLETMGPPRSTTLLVEGIPPEQRSDQSLYRYFVKLFSEKAVHRAYVIRRTWSLRRHLSQLERLEERLASCEAAWEASGRSEDTYFDMAGWAGGARGEAVLVKLRKEVAEARVSLKEERERVAQAEKHPDNAVSSTSGFVTFTSRRWARLASREQLRADPSQMKLSQAPAVDDVRYDDLATDQSSQASSVLLEVLLTAMVFIMWVPITGLIASATSLQDLKGYRALSFLNDLPDTFQHILEGVCAQLALKIVLAILPMVLMIIINLNFLKCDNQAQLRMQNRYFMFLVVFVVLVSALSQTLLHTLKQIIADPRNVTLLLAKLPDSAHFYINYIVTAMFTLSMALLRISPFAKFVLFKTEEQTAADVRKDTEPEDQDGDGMGARFAKVTHMMTITLVFCHASPSITLAALAWFTLAGYVYRWLTLYSETKKPDLGGAFYDQAIKHLFYSLLMYCFIMFTIMLNAPWGPAGPALAALAACGYVWSSYDQYCSLAWEQMPFEKLVEQEAVRQADAHTSSSSSLMAEEKAQYAQAECIIPEEDKVAKEPMEGKRSDGSH